MRVWLVTWEWAGGHAAVPPNQRVAAILSGRLGGERVREITELLYANSRYTLHERLSYARNKRNNPYPATFGSLRGLPWEGQIICGHNPYLFARLVDNVAVRGDPPDEQLVWNNLPKPDVFTDP